MAAGFSIEIDGIRILSSEALYQAMRYPANPDYQSEIIRQKSPMTAKMISKKYRPHTREDWEDVKLIIMRWCLRVKLIQNWDKFGSLLLNTSDKQIVEESNKDDYWGARPSDINLLVGTNALGRLLMELRQDLPIFLGENELVPPSIRNFKMYGKSIESIKFDNKVMPKDVQDYPKPEYKNFSLFD